MAAKKHKKQLQNYSGRSSSSGEDRIKTGASESELKSDPYFENYKTVSAANSIGIRPLVFSKIKREPPLTKENNKARVD